MHTHVKRGSVIRYSIGFGSIRVSIHVIITMSKCYSSHLMWLGIPMQ